MFYKQKRILPFHEADAGPADGVVEVEAEESSLWPRVGRTALFFALSILLPLLLGQRADRYPWRYRQGVCGGRGRSRSRRSRAVGAHGAGVGLSGASTSMGLPGERAQGWALERRVSPTGWHVTRDRDSGTAGIVCLCERQRGELERKRESAENIVGGCAVTSFTATLYYATMWA